jgi:DNA recombination protein RmuC
MVGTLEARVLPTARKLNSLDAAGLTTPVAVEVTPRSVAAPELQSAQHARSESGEDSEESAA